MDPLSRQVHEGTTTVPKTTILTGELSLPETPVFLPTSVVDQAPVAQRVDNAIQRINRYPADKC